MSTRRDRHRGWAPSSAPTPLGTLGEWATMLTAKYLGLSNRHGSSIAHGVHVAHAGRRHRTTVNNDISSELGWLSHVNNQTSPHHNKAMANMWRALTYQGLDTNARLPAIYRALSEVLASIKARTKHCGTSKYN